MKEKEFNMSRVYWAGNADELKSGDMVVVADNLRELREKINTSFKTLKIGDNLTVRGEEFEYRFKEKEYASNLAYLVERATEPEYVPFTSIEEVVPYFGKTIEIIETGSKYVVIGACLNQDGEVHICYWNAYRSAKNMLKQVTIDGRPFGKLKDD